MAQAATLATQEGAGIATKRTSHWLIYALSAAIMAVTTVPYLYGLWLEGTQPRMGWYSGFSYNVSDSCVYLAWMKRAAEGHFFEYNLFTTEPQGGWKFNLFYFSLGWLGGRLHLPPALAYHLARLILGVALLRAIWWLLERLLPGRRARWAAFFITVFSAGLGWVIMLLAWERTIEPNDLWQPEGFTFLCLYWSPLFIASLLLMVGIIGFLMTAEQKQTWRHAFYAGFCALLLGNIHTYDIVAIAFAWGGFLVLRCLFRWGISVRDLRSLARAGIAGGMAAISGGYMYYILRTDPVFAERVSVQTLSPPLLCYLLGYGLTLALAAAGILLALRWQLTRQRIAAPLHKSGGRTSGAGNRRAWTDLGLKLGVSKEGAILLAVWLLSHFVAAYLPVPYQRKLLMGVHLPMSILAGVAVAYLLRGLRSWRWGLAVAAIVLALAPSHASFLWGDMQDLRGDRNPYNTIRPYMYRGEVQALDWLRKNARPGAAIQPLPWVEVADVDELGGDRNGPVDRRGRHLLRIGVPSLSGKMYVVFDTTVACFAPGLTGHFVDVGHIGESPDYFKKTVVWSLFATPVMSGEFRLNLLRESGVKYLLFSQKHSEDYPFTGEEELRGFWHSPPSYLKPIREASNDDAEVYEVVLP